MSPNSRKDLKLAPSVELSSHNTALALEQTSMSIDRTQMSVLRTSLSLIGFGFTIYKFFQEVGKSAGRENAFAPPARHLGLTLVILGVGLLVAGLANHYFMLRAVHRRRRLLYDEGLLRSPPTYRTSPNMVASVLLLIAGSLVLLGLLARIGPFG
jgi:inner membrane protein YidH